MARRRGRLILGILGGVVGLLILAVILLPLLVPREHLRNLAEQQVREATGGEVSLGQLSLRVLPRLRLVLGESSVTVTGDGLREAGQDPGPLVAAAATLERLEVDLALWPLLRRELEFGEVRLIGPELDIVTLPPVDPDAVSDDPDARVDAPPVPAAMDFGLALAAVEVRDGRIHWREDGTDREVVVRGWQQDMTAPQLGVLLSRLQRLGGEDLPPDQVAGPVALELKTQLASLELRGFAEQPLPPLTDLELLGELALPPAADRAEFTVHELRMPGWLVTGRGHATLERVLVEELELTGGEAIAARGAASLTLPPLIGPLSSDLTGRVDLALIMAQLEPWLPPLPPDAPPLPALTGSLEFALEAALATTPPFDDPEAWTAAWQRGLEGSATLTATGGPVTVDTPELGETLRIGRLELSSDLRAATGVTRLVASDLAHPAVQGRAVAEIIPAAGEDQAVQARLELPRLDLDALAVLVEAMQTAAVDPRPQPGRTAGFSLVTPAWAQPRGQAAAAAQPAPGELIPPDLAVDLSATVEQIVFLKSPYTSARMTGMLRERVIEVSELTAQLGTGRVRGQAQLDYATDPRGHASWDVRVEDAPAALLLSPYVPVIAALWTGTLSANAAGSANLADPQALLNSLSLAGDMRGSNGVVDLREPLAGVSSYLGQRQDLLRVQYNQMRQIFKIEDGRVKLDGLRIDGRDTDWRGGGSLGLDGTLDLGLNVRLPAGFTPNLGDLTFLADALRDQDGRISLDFLLTGDARRPTVALDLDPAAMLQSDAVKDKLQEEGREELQKLQEEVKKGAASLLERLRGGR